MNNKDMPQYWDIQKSKNPAGYGAVNTVASTLDKKGFHNPWEDKAKQDKSHSFIWLEHHLMSINIAVH